MSGIRNGILNILNTQFWIHNTTDERQKTEYESVDSSTICRYPTSNCTCTEGHELLLDWVSYNFTWRRWSNTTLPLSLHRRALLASVYFITWTSKNLFWYPKITVSYTKQINCLLNFGYEFGIRNFWMCIWVKSAVVHLYNKLLAAAHISKHDTATRQVPKKTLILVGSTCTCTYWNNRIISRCINSAFSIF